MHYAHCTLSQTHVDDCHLKIRNLIISVFAMLYFVFWSYEWLKSRTPNLELRNSIVSIFPMFYLVFWSYEWLKSKTPNLELSVTHVSSFQDIWLRAKRSYGEHNFTCQSQWNWSRLYTAYLKTLMTDNSMIERLSQSIVSETTRAVGQWSQLDFS